VNDDLERAVRLLTVELADLKVALAEMRLVFATDRTQALELPNPLPKRAGHELIRARPAARGDITRHLHGRNSPNH